ncbi:methylphosphotriester-DNA--protein-cysteine methyltransferase family protein [Paraburkholderia sp. UCT2]|nr:methylphosphotriester-DNA--protein-cysteine methyltransferase family protein [Paraburkholderia sp. UCT2]
MSLDPDICYQTLLSRDRRFDGWFFVAVSSTGIYCRPVCPVRTPKRQSCHFFPNAAAAEKAGFRPCLRCRPELAPGNGLLDVSARLAHAAAMLIEAGFLNTASLAKLAARVGVTDRHLQRIFDAEYGVSMIEFAQTALSGCWEASRKMSR